jgi:hypothetical protein
MLKTVRARLTYANVMATLAVFLGLAGGAYALSGVPDGSGVYRACVEEKSGAVRVVAKASSCRKAQTVKRGKRRVRIPGESAIAWNQKGQPGTNGNNGTNGVNGVNGAANLIVRSKSLGFVSSGTDTADFALCNPGERAVSGGMSHSDGGHGVGDAVTQSGPAVQGSPTRLATAGETPNAWITGVHVGASGLILLYAICASP